MAFKKMKKEELELLSYKEITELALRDLGPQKTKDLFDLINKKLEREEKDFEDKITDYYTMLSTDKRFKLLKDGKWDLAENHISEKKSQIEEDDEELIEEDEEELIDEDEEEDDEEDTEDDEIDADLDDDDDEENDFDDDDNDLTDLEIIKEEEL